MKSGFLDRLIGRLDRLDPESLQTHFLRLVQEKGLLETIFQSIQEGVVVVDGSGKITYANKAAERLTGLSLDTMKGRTISRYIREIDWDRILEFDETEWSTLLSREIEITYPEHRFINFYVVPLSPTPEHEKGAVIILRDVTRDRQYEANMKESERVNAVKLLAAGVAHEIGNPLNALTIHLQLLDREIRKVEKPARKELEELVDIARKEVARLDTIITQFLRAVRPARLRLLPTRIENVLNETLAMLRQEIRDRQIDVSVDCPSSLPRIHVDRDQMKQAFYNIIRNAFQAMPGGGELRIALAGSDRFLKISFLDTGRGIPPEDMSRVFDPYYTTKPDGSGLGLMIVQRIVQEHGGVIELSSKPNVGTSFTILLPLLERRVRLLKAPKTKTE